MKQVIPFRSQNDAIIQEMRKFTPPNAGTAKVYQGAIRVYLEFCDVSGMSPGCAESLREYQERLIKAGNNERTINTAIAGIRKGILTAAINLGMSQRDYENLKSSLIGKDGIKQITIPVNIKEDRILTPEELELVIKKASPRTRLFIEFLSSTGCRASEMIGAMWKKITPKNNGIKVLSIIGKGKKQRLIDIPLDLLDRIHEVFNGKTYLFESVKGKQISPIYMTQEISKVIAKTLKGKRSSAHDLRHYFATEMIKKTGKIKAVSQYLGHSSVKITLDIYTHEKLTAEDLFGGSL